MSETGSPIRVLLADDSQLLLEAIRRMLEGEFRVVGSASDGISLMREARRLNPDVMVVDVSMPYMTGLEAVRLMHDEKVPARAVMLTIDDDPAVVEEAMDCGAYAFVRKASADRDLADAIRAVAAGDRFISANVRI